MQNRIGLKKISQFHLQVPGFHLQVPVRHLQSVPFPDAKAASKRVLQVLCHYPWDTPRGIPTKGLWTALSEHVCRRHLLSGSV